LFKYKEYITKNIIIFFNINDIINLPLYNKFLNYEYLTILDYSGGRSVVNNFRDSHVGRD
jgi:hypothetical protein